MCLYNYHKNRKFEVSFYLICDFIFIKIINATYLYLFVETDFAPKLHYTEYVF